MEQLGLISKKHRKAGVAGRVARH